MNKSIVNFHLIKISVEWVPGGVLHDVDWQPNLQHYIMSHN